MQLLDLIQSAGGLGAIAKEVGLTEAQAQTGAAALLPAIVGGFKQQAQGGGLQGLASLLTSAGGAGLLENLVSSGPTNTQAGKNVLGQILGSKEVSREVAGRAAQQTGLSVESLKKMLPLLAMAATGILAKQGGEGGLLGQLGGLLGGSTEGASGLGKLLDADGDGNPINDVLGAAGKFFGR